MQCRRVRPCVLACLCAGTMAVLGCNGGHDASNQMVRSVQDMVITGSVGDGPVVDATIEVVAADGATVAQAVGSSTATYHALVPAKTLYPIRLRAIGGIDLVTQRAPDFVLETLITRPDQTVANLSPFSTLVSRVASCATTRPNQAKLAQVWERVMLEFGMGYDVERFGHPSWTRMESANTAPFVLASEAFGESIRRTQKALANSPGVFDGDSLLAALACDFAPDGLLDGNGDGSSRRITATFHAASAGVLVETMTRRLRVDELDATARLDASIQQTRSDAGSVLDVELSPLLIRQTRDRLAALLRRAPDDVVARLLRLLDQTPAADLPAVIAASMSGADEEVFASTARALAMADDRALDVVLVNESVVRPVLSIAAAPANIGAGETARLSWAAVEAKTCWASGAWEGEQPLTGTRTTSPLTTSARYALTCTGLGGTVSHEVSVAVAGALPPAVPRVLLSATPGTVAPGESTTLAWSASGATECNAGGDWSGSRPPEGRAVVGPLDTVKSYSLSCTGPGGTSNDIVGVMVREAPVPVAVTTSIQASPAWIARGASTNLSWSSNGATQCTGSGAWSGDRPTAGTAAVAPSALDNTFIISCTGPGGTAVSSATVSLRAARLSWRALDEQLPARDVIGFRVFHGTTPGVYGPPTAVSDPSVRQLEMDLSPGTHYFAVGSLNSSGTIEALSNEVSKTVE